MEVQPKTLADLFAKYSAPKYWPTWLGLGLLRLISFLPLPFLSLVGYVIGAFVYLVHFSRRRIAEKNLTACFPEYSKWKIMKINFHHFCLLGQSLITTSMNWWISPKRFKRLVTIHGKEHYENALNNGERVILLAPHFLSLEVSGLALQSERPMVGMYQYMKNELLDELALIKRKRFCPDGIMFERKGPLRQLLKILIKGYPLSYSPDQDAMRKGVFVPFFHSPASTTPALAKFVQTVGSVVIPCRNHILPWGRGYEVYLGAPIEGLASGDEINDTTAMNQVIERMVREAPEQYLWVHKRFKTRPAGDAPFYE